ncbi:MAG TPA: 3-methyl-2-oxobutanoate hydroxymethyltransferase [Gemmatimonadaceae bacterium]
MSSESRRDDRAPRPVTVRDIVGRKGGEKLVMVTAYDVLFARICDESGVDIILVGDSLGNVVAGFETTLRVTLDQMIYHGAAVRRGTARALLVVDMPFLTYHVSTEDALRNCGRVMQETGAQAVKLEGAGEEILAAVRALVRCGIPVMGHVGFTPQSVHALGGFRVQGREEEAAARLVADARALEEAGVFSIVLELVPAEVARRVTDAVRVPTIGIGAGAACDGQVLVLPDLLGLNEGFAPKFLKRYANLAADARDALRRFGDEVRSGAYPDDAHSF